MVSGLDGHFTRKAFHPDGLAMYQREWVGPDPRFESSHQPCCRSPNLMLQLLLGVIPANAHISQCSGNSNSKGLGQSAHQNILVVPGTRTRVIQGATVAAQAASERSQVGGDRRIV